MDKETIMNTYAIEQGYKNWSAILFQFQDDFNYASPEDENNVMNWIEHHISAVTDLIQEELKKKIASESNIEIIEHRGGYKSKAKSYSYGEYKFQVDEESILNTEIL